MTLLLITILAYAVLWVVWLIASRLLHRKGK
jgi:hypothetical protein